MHNQLLPGCLLVWICFSRSIQGQTNLAIHSSDSRYRLLQAFPNDETPPAAPAGIESSQVSLWRYAIGAPATPSLMIATSNDHRRVWIDPKRDGVWKELSAENDNSFQGEIRSYAAPTPPPAWPSPSVLPIHIRYEAAFDLWHIASLAELSGQMELAGQPTKYLVHDENSDGRFESSDDTIRLDLNGNGSLEALSEVYPLACAVRCQGKRYALGLDSAKGQIQAERIEATGSASLHFEGWDALQSEPTSFLVTLQSRSGIQAVINSAQPVEVPVGEYQLLSAVLNWDGEQKWKMFFSRLDAASSPTFTVTAGQSTRIPLLGPTELSAEIVKEQTFNRQWQVTIQPMFKTASGLYLTLARFGRTEATTSGTLVATVHGSHGRTASSADSPGDEKVLTAGSTQFACGTFCPIELKWKDRPASHITLSFDSGPLAGVMTSKIELKQAN